MKKDTKENLSTAGGVAAVAGGAAAMSKRGRKAVTSRFVKRKTAKAVKAGPRGVFKLASQSKRLNQGMKYGGAGLAVGGAALLARKAFKKKKEE